MLRQIDPDLEPKEEPQKESQPLVDEERIKLRGGQRRSLQDVLNPARFHQADGIKQPTRAHIPVSALILAAALIVLVAYLLLPWVHDGTNGMRGGELTTMVLDRKPGLSPTEIRGEVIPLALVFLMSVFIAARATLNIYLREDPARGAWFWLLLASIINLYPLLHTFFIMDALGDIAFGVAGSASPASGYWYAVLGSVPLPFLAAAGWFFLSSEEN